ncbi:glycosyltransferase family 2 protein [bacterium]|nr:glycosyltransferase family 2 protein [bacterium]
MYLFKKRVRVEANPKVSTIIPHAGGRKLLDDCLKSLYLTKGVSFETIIIDNCSFEKVTDEPLGEYPDLRVLRYEHQLGFAGACNRGVEAASGEYIFLLNNDAVVLPDTIRLLSLALDDDNTVAACQPKILSLQQTGMFDYSSACGGEIDRYGFPFARGRIFDTVEDDNGQYDYGGYIFWGAGTALMIRRDLYLSAGGLEEPFFAHMEEIDLQWRLQLMGHRILVVPSAVVKHLGAATIHSESFTKMYLNHRNSLAMLFRNYSFRSLIRFFPARILLDFTAIIRSIFCGDFKRSWAVTRAGCWFWLSMPYLIKGRICTQRLRILSEREILLRIYPCSIVLQYFLSKRRTFGELKTIKSSYGCD